MKKFIKKNRFTIFALFFLIVLFILLIVAKNIFFPNFGSAFYGDRLNGIVEIKKEDKNNVIDFLKQNENVIETKVDVKGKRFETYIIIKDEVSKNDAKNIASSILEKISEEIKKDYDVQVYISKNNNELNDFPIAGYKHKNKDGFSWTRDREIVEKEKENEGEK